MRWTAAAVGHSVPLWVGVEPGAPHISCESPHSSSQNARRELPGGSLQSAPGLQPPDVVADQARDLITPDCNEAGGKPCGKAWLDETRLEAIRSNGINRRGT